MTDEQAYKCLCVGCCFEKQCHEDMDYCHNILMATEGPTMTDATTAKMTDATTANWNYNNNYCLHRLPCGYCKELNRVCPMIGRTTNGSFETIIINSCTTTGNIDQEADND